MMLKITKITLDKTIGEKLGIGNNNMKSENRKVPVRVLRVMSIVRNIGAFNMLDKSNICATCKSLDDKAGLWMNKFCGGKCHKAYKNYSIVLDQFSQYLKDNPSEIRNSE